MRVPLLLLVLWCAVASSHGQPPRAQGEVLERLRKEAGTFARKAHLYVGRETLRQYTPDFRRPAVRGAAPAAPVMKMREVVSEYGLLWLDQAGSTLQEVRRVIAVDGQPVKQGARAMGSLARSIAAGSEQQRRRLLEDFEKNGLQGVATNFTPILLIFTESNLERFELSLLRTASLEGESTQVYSFRQIDGAGGMTIFEKAKMNQIALVGEVWIRERDLMPMRVVVVSAHEEDKLPVRDISTVDYAMSPHGVVLPKQVRHRQFAGDRLRVEDVFSYENFHLFSELARQ